MIVPESLSPKLGSNIRTIFASLCSATFALLCYVKIEQNAAIQRNCYRITAATKEERTNRYSKVGLYKAHKLVCVSLSIKCGVLSSSGKTNDLQISKH